MDNFIHEQLIEEMSMDFADDIFVGSRLLHVSVMCYENSNIPNGISIGSLPAEKDTLSIGIEGNKIEFRKDGKIYHNGKEIGNSDDIPFRLKDALVSLKQLGDKLNEKDTGALSKIYTSIGQHQSSHTPVDPYYTHVDPFFTHDPGVAGYGSINLVNLDVTHYSSNITTSSLDFDTDVNSWHKI